MNNQKPDRSVSLGVFVIVSLITIAGLVGIGKLLLEIKNSLPPKMKASKTVM